MRCIHCGGALSECEGCGAGFCDACAGSCDACHEDGLKQFGHLRALAKSHVQACRDLGFPSFVTDAEILEAARKVRQ